MITNARYGLQNKHKDHLIALRDRYVNILDYNFENVPTRDIKLCNELTEIIDLYTIKIDGIIE